MQIVSILIYILSRFFFLLYAIIDIINVTSLIFYIYFNR